MHCTYCGEELPENAKYCPNCGRKCAPGHCSRRRYILWGAVVLAAALCFAAVLVFALPLFGAENSSPVSPTPLPAPADKGFLSLSTEPAGASVKVGGEYKGVTPLTVELIPGTSYMVSVELNGKVWAESVSVKAGEKRSVGLKLNADAAEETPVPTLSPADAEKNLASRIAAAIEPANAGVRSYALGAIAASSAGAYNVRQVCDIYDA
ncbi:MAG: PEGA domain-containing protein, partial [Methanocorpusculum sp.]|nr:PEGA domain-containing protein [Methanocorpusculum sp.]